MAERIEESPDTPFVLGFWQHDIDAEALDLSAIGVWIKELEQKWGRKLESLEIKRQGSKKQWYRAFAIIVPVKEEAADVES